VGIVGSRFRVHSKKIKFPLMARTERIIKQKPLSKLCQSPDGCHRFAQGRSKFCISHGGGNICEFAECKRSAQGTSQFCIRHGGGRRCLTPGCKTSARGSTGFCVIHGGGIQCKHEGCTKTAQRPTDFCIAHGGGKRCSFLGCSASIRSTSAGFCKKHLAILP